MLHEFKSLKFQQLQSLESLSLLQALPRPPKGWIRAIREAAGVSAGELGRTLGVSRQLPLQFEKAEAEDSITLKSLRSVANALNCDLVYVLVPRAGAMETWTRGRDLPRAEELASHKGRTESRGEVGAIEETQRTMTSTHDETQWDSHYCD